MVKDIGKGLKNAIVKDDVDMFAVFVRTHGSKIKPKDLVNTLCEFSRETLLLWFMDNVEYPQNMRPHILVKACASGFTHVCSRLLNLDDGVSPDKMYAMEHCVSAAIKSERGEILIMLLTASNDEQLYFYALKELVSWNNAVLMMQLLDSSSLTMMRDMVDEKRLLMLAIQEASYKIVDAVLSRPMLHAEDSYQQCYEMACAGTNVDILNMLLLTKNCCIEKSDFNIDWWMDHPFLPRIIHALITNIQKYEPVYFYEMREKLLAYCQVSNTATDIIDIKGDAPIQESELIF